MTERDETEVVYEPPHVERVLSPEELEREMQYAGDEGGSTGDLA